MKIVCIDTETGGLNENQHSLLSLCVAVVENGEMLGSIEMFIKENEYCVTPQAMNINKIDLSQAYDLGVTHREAVEKIQGFMKHNFGDDKAIIMGHNVGFDIRFLKVLFDKVGQDFEKTFSHRSIDTATLLQFLSMTGRFEGKEVKSLSGARDYFGITFDGEHTAHGDVSVTIRVFNELSNIVNSKQERMLSEFEADGCEHISIWTQHHDKSVSDVVMLKKKSDKIWEQI